MERRDLCSRSSIQRFISEATKDTAICENVVLAVVVIIYCDQRTILKGLRRVNFLMDIKILFYSRKKSP
jgi:hypothetical protein